MNILKIFVILQGLEMDKFQPILLDNLYYLGDRNYIQGGTIYELFLPKLLQRFSDIKSLDFTYRSIIHQNLIFFDKQRENSIIKVVLNLKCADRTYKLYGYHQEEIQTIKERIPYDEKEILKTAIIHDSNIYLNAPFQKISVVRYVIAMNKELLNFLFKSEIENFKWFLSRLTLNQVIDESRIQEIHLQYLSRFEFQIVKTEIFINQKSVGFIYFSLKREDYVF